MKHCALCGWSGPDTATQCPHAAAHPTRAVQAEIQRERERAEVLVGGVRADGVRGPVRHWRSDRIGDVYQTADGRYVTADGRPVRSGKKRLR